MDPFIENVAIGPWHALLEFSRLPVRKYDPSGWGGPVDQHALAHLWVPVMPLIHTALQISVCNHCGACQLWIRVWKAPDSEQLVQSQNLKRQPTGAVR